MALNAMSDLLFGVKRKRVRIHGAWPVSLWTYCYRILLMELRKYMINFQT
jgi:hypothetical protein